MRYKRDLESQRAFVAERFPAYIQEKTGFPVAVDSDVVDVIAQRRVFKGESVWLNGEMRSDIQIRLVLDLQQSKNKPFENQ